MRIGRFFAWAARPRYGFIHMLVACVAIAGACRAVWKSQFDPLFDAMRVSDLPAARVIGTSCRPPDHPYRGRYEFTTDWFVHHIPAWEAAMAPYRGRPGVRYLEIGAFEGRSVLWMSENILTDPTSHATVVDVFYGDYESRYRANVARSGAADRIETLKAPSQLALRSLPLESFDIIYIDGSHATADVLEDAVLSWRLLKADGLLIFDDYQWIGALAAGHARDAATDWPKPAIDAFCRCFAGRFDVVHNDSQLMLRKRAEKAVAEMETSGRSRDIAQAP